MPDDIEFVVRGAPTGTAAGLRESIRSLSGLPSLPVVVRPYSTEAERLTADLLRASLVLMPSRKEGLGLVGVEAIVAGTPVLISGSSGLGALLRDVLRADDVGRVVVSMSGDDQEITDRWARAIEAVLRDREAAFQRAADVRRYLAEHKKWSSTTQGLLKALNLLPREGQTPGEPDQNTDPPPPRASQGEDPTAREADQGSHMHSVSQDPTAASPTFNERRLDALGRALRQVVPSIYRNPRIRVRKLAAANSALLSVGPIMQALSAVAEAENRQPMRHKLQQLDHTLKQHYCTVSQKLSALEQVRSEEDAVQPCQDLATETAKLLAACDQAIQVIQAIQRVT